MRRELPEMVGNGQYACVCPVPTYLFVMGKSLSGSALGSKPPDAAVARNAFMNMRAKIMRPFAAICHEDMAFASSFNVYIYIYICLFFQMQAGVFSRGQSDDQRV
jgi:hypothetical protein